VSLPLIERANSPHDPSAPLFRITEGPLCLTGFPGAPSLIPQRALEPGEQYRFHFDMTRCIGCKCCEVACSEQNGNPDGIRWRRVGEIEGGEYPFTQRHYLSMGCNHCLDAACLNGCPVEAYTKDALTGLVLHSADACIGCQYCTWNCPYGVPQYNPERGVVGKCDMCHGRLSEGREPACVNACPESAIEIEIVNMAEWRADCTSANAPGLPPAEHTLSTTRVTLPTNVLPNLEKADYHRVRPEHPHWPLVLMTVLTQLSVGAFAFLVASGASNPLAAVAALLVAFLSLGASTAHLGRPAFAYRALKMWRRSWLSREVLLFSLFAGSATMFAAGKLLGFTVPGAGILTLLFGIGGVTASAFIYVVPARPAWNLWNTPVNFYLTGLVLGPLFLGALGLNGDPRLIAAAARVIFRVTNRGERLGDSWLNRIAEDA